MNTVTKGKINRKRTKQTGEFGAEGINNTAPVKKILEDLYSNSQAHKLYCQTVRPKRTNRRHGRQYHFAVVGHPLNHFSDDWDGDLNSGYFEHFPYRCFPPRIISNMKNVDKSDPVTEYMKLQEAWRQNCLKMKSSAITTHMIEKYEELNEEVAQCPKHLIDMAAQLDSEPDPLFDSSYNWYYAGNGNLQLACVDWVDYLVHNLTKFSKVDLVLNTEHAASYDCGKNNNILETIVSVNNIIALRTKKKIYLLKIVTSYDKLEIEYVKVIENEISYTSISFDNYHKNIMYVTTLDCNLTIVNLDRLKGRSVKLKSNITTLVDNWNMVIGSGRISYTHASRDVITTYDKRTNNPYQTWKGTREFTDEVTCNDITVVKQFAEKSLYFATDHHLFLMDSRYKTSKPVQRWTHGMQCVPTYMSMCHFEFNKELICLSSQWCEDTCVVANYTDILKRERETPGILIPYRPPNVFSTLNEARERRLCFDLYNPIDNRLGTALTGNLVIENGENYVILTQNSLGDISSHVLFPEHMETFMEDNSVEYLNEWSKSYKHKDKPFEVSAVKDFTQVWKMLKKVPESHTFGIEKFKVREKFNEKEMFAAFEDGGLDNGLLDVWVNQDKSIDDSNVNKSGYEESSLALNLYYSESE